MSFSRPDLDVLLTALFDACRAHLALSPLRHRAVLEFLPSLHRISLRLDAREAVLAPSVVSPDRVVLFGRPSGARVCSFELPRSHTDVALWADHGATAALDWVSV